MKKEFKVGQRVRVYDHTGIFIGVVTRVHDCRSLIDITEEDGEVYSYFTKQCRRLVPKKKKIFTKAQLDAIETAWVCVQSDYFRVDLELLIEELEKL